MAYQVTTAPEALAITGGECCSREKPTLDTSANTPATPLSEL